MPKGQAITLKYQHDWNEDAVLSFSCNKCSVYFIQDVDSSQPTFIELRFHKTQTVRSARTDCTPAIGIYPEDLNACFIVELTDSTWPTEARKAYIYADSPIKPSGRHFVVSNHDIFHEILAESFTELLLKPGDSGYEFAKTLFNL